MARLIFNITESKAKKVADSNQIVKICKDGGYDITDFVARIVWEDVSEAEYGVLWQDLPENDKDVLNLVLRHSSVLEGF